MAWMVRVWSLHQDRTLAATKVPARCAQCTISTCLPSTRRCFPTQSLPHLKTLHSNESSHQPSDHKQFPQWRLSASVSAPEYRHRIKVHGSLPSIRHRPEHATLKCRPVQQAVLFSPGVLPTTYILTNHPFTAIGIIGLAGLISTCIQGYQIIVDISLFERETGLLFTKFDIEGLRFVQWIEDSGKTDRSSSSSSSSQPSGHLTGRRADQVIQKTLQQMLVFLRQAAALQRKYDVVYRSEVSGREYNAEGRRIGNRRKFMFTLSDKNDFTHIIDELGYFNDRLPYMIPSVELRRAIRARLASKPSLLGDDDDGLAWADIYPPASMGTGAAGLAGDMAGETVREGRSRSLRGGVVEQGFGFVGGNYRTLSSVSPPPPYTRSQVSSTGSRRSHVSRSSAGSGRSTYSRQSSGDAAREMFGDLLGRNGRRYSAYR